MRRNQYTGAFYVAMKLVVFGLSLSFLSCADDLREDPGISPPSPGQTQDAEVHLTINTPGTSIPRSVAAVSMDMEYAVSDICILVFTKENNEFRYKYSVEGQQLRPDGSDPQKTHFTALLKTSENPIKLVLIANTSGSFDKYIPAGTTEKEIRKEITTEFAGNYTGALPMYGEKELPYISAEQIPPLSVTMLRAVARVDVEVDLKKELSKDFVLRSVYIYRANNRIQMIPDAESMSASGTLQVKSPSVPGEATYTNPYSKVVTEPGQSLIDKLYVPESFSTDPGLFKDATCIVVGGNYNGEDRISYYRADFNSGETGHPFGQVLRNHRYHFKIKQVNASGWETPDEAANNRTTTLEMEIKTWEDFTKEMYVNGDNYLGVTSRNVVFGYKKGLKKAVGVQSTVPYRISWADRGETAAAGDQPISNNYFTAQVVTYPGDAGDVSYILLETLRENKSTANFVSELKVEWGSWIFTIQVSQKHYSEATMRSVRILTAGTGVGALGAIAGGNQNGNMRPYLINPDNFSPDGTVDFFAGFSFAQLLPEYFYDNVNEANFNRVKAEIYAADVIFLNYDNQCGRKVAAIIQEWLSGSPNRVLILGGDGEATSMGFLRSDYGGLALNDVDWKFNLKESIQATGSGTFSFSPLTLDNQDIMEGPFGTVDLNATMVCADRTFGYAKEIKNKDIIPLMYHSNSPVGTPYMTFGIDKVKGVFYHGDGSAFEAGRLPSGKGVVSTNNEIFWANVWAWIAHQVVWGDDELIED